LILVGYVIAISYYIKKKNMEIVCIDSTRDKFELRNAYGEVVTAGTQDECLMTLCDLSYYEDQMAYQQHLHLGTF
jgi:hypothetical protein